jgi:hypothetical protein
MDPWLLAWEPGLTTKNCVAAAAPFLSSQPFLIKRTTHTIPQRPHSHEALATGSQISCLIPFPGYLTRSACLCSVDLPASALFSGDRTPVLSLPAPFESPFQASRTLLIPQPVSSRASAATQPVARPPHSTTRHARPPHAYPSNDIHLHERAKPAHRRRLQAFSPRELVLVWIVRRGRWSGRAHCTQLVRQRDQISPDREQRCACCGGWQQQWHEHLPGEWQLHQARSPCHGPHHRQRRRFTGRPQPQVLGDN